MPVFLKRLVPLLALAGVCLGMYGQASADNAPLALQAANIAPNSCVRPVYPSASVAAKQTGVVTLSLDIDASGKLTAAHVIKSSGYPALDEAARDGITKCRFLPGLADGKPVNSSFRMQYVWSLG
ncbi:MAG: hypothetical protein RLZZ237_2445 [Pseudomonadota bacterium]|jgi:D-alanyl-D-alanine endopeptidase (penicillin-binding protein 7)